MLNYEFPPLGGGTGQACAELLAEQAGQPGLSVDLVTSGSGRRLRVQALSKGVRVHRLPVSKRDPQYWRGGELIEWAQQALPYARRLHARQRYDLTHCWSGWPAGLIGWLLRKHAPYLVSMRGSDVPGYNLRLRQLDPILFRPLVRRIWGGAAHLSAVSARLRDLAWRTCPDRDIDVLPNGVDTSIFRPGAVGPRRDLVFVGRLIPRKGVHHLLEAFAVLDVPGPAPGLTIIGGGPERQKLEALAVGLGLGERVRFTGHLDRGTLAEQLAGAGIFVLPALSDAMPNAVLEGMAAGLAIVTTDTGASELIDGNGQVVPIRDVAALHAAMARYLGAPGLLESHQSRSRALALGLTWQHVARRYLQIYRQVALSRCPSERGLQRPHVADDPARGEPHGCGKTEVQYDRRRQA